MTKTENELYRALIECCSLLKSHASNWDCDKDGHNYGTSCRACDAKEQVERTKPIILKHKDILLDITSNKDEQV